MNSKISQCIKHDYDNNLFRYYIDSPKIGHVVENERFLIDGWFLSEHILQNLCVEIDGKAHTYMFNKTRLDVKKNLNILDSSILTYGFHHEIVSPISGIKLGVCLDNRVIWLCEFQIGEFDNSLLKVVSGENGHLFLNNYTNLSIEQYIGKQSLTGKMIEGWRNYFDIFNTLNVDKKLFLIVPSKEELFGEYYPYERAKFNICDQFLNEFSSQGLLYPLEVLFKDKEFSYLKADTHWSDYGAYISAKRILKYFDLSNYDHLLQNNFILSEFRGDLGNKLPQRQMVIGLKSSRYIMPNFDNAIHNHGRIWIFNNINAPVKDTLMIFGDSFAAGINANYVANQMSAIFNKVVFMHSAGAIDESVINYEKPKYIICEMNQRFIIRPLDKYDIWQVIDKKLKILKKEELFNLKLYLSKYDTEQYGFYTNRILNLLNNIIE